MKEATKEKPTVLTRADLPCWGCGSNMMPAVIGCPVHNPSPDTGFYDERVKELNEKVRDRGPDMRNLLKQIIAWTEGEPGLAKVINEKINDR